MLIFSSLCPLEGEVNFCVEFNFSLAHLFSAKERKKSKSISRTNTLAGAAICLVSFEK